VRQICQAVGISRQAYYAARREPTAEREQRPRSSRPGPWATAEELEAGIRRVAAANPAWGVRKVWATLRREGVIASRKRVWALMRALDLVLAPLRERDDWTPRGQVKVADSNRRWASDLTTTWTRQDGMVALVPVIDCGDRFVFEIGVSKSQESPIVLGPVERTLWGEFGRPEVVPAELELRTDHGSQYTGADAESLCKRWGIDHTFAPVGRPTGNAVAERVIQTLKIELLWTRDWESLEEVEQAVREWVVRYNTARPHQALGWQTPAERRAKNLGEPTKAAA
jgi:putative transposase